MTARHIPLHPPALEALTIGSHRFSLPLLSGSLEGSPSAIDNDPARELAAGASHLGLDRLSPTETSSHPQARGVGGALPGRDLLRPVAARTAVTQSVTVALSGPGPRVVQQRCRWPEVTPTGHHSPWCRPEWPSVESPMRLMAR